jgi:hypothetical protein
MEPQYSPKETISRFEKLLAELAAREVDFAVVWETASKLFNLELRKSGTKQGQDSPDEQNSRRSLASYYDLTLLRRRN